MVVTGITVILLQKILKLMAVIKALRPHEKNGAGEFYVEY